ncbi:MAG: hypothetical protein LQ344_005315 [Seirophora lacunosa]|nr:MAG: hypothetical protein LQ344_005315 [Seirophora lacunosa]
MTETIDCLCQTAPHVIVFEPLTSLCRAQLYDKMIAKEREIYETHKRRSGSPQPVSKRACRWYRRFIHPEEQEKGQPSSRSEGVECRPLAAHVSVGTKSPYTKNAREARRTKEAAISAVKRERLQEQSERRDVAEMRQCANAREEVSQEVCRNGLTITTTAIFPSSSSSSTLKSSASTQRTLPSSASVYSGDSIGRAGTRSQYRVPSWNPGFEAIPAFVSEERDADEDVLLAWGQSVDEECNNVPARSRWWQRLSIRGKR